MEEGERIVAQAENQSDQEENMIRKLWINCENAQTKSLGTKNCIPETHCYKFL